MCSIAKSLARKEVPNQVLETEKADKGFTQDEFTSIMWDQSGSHIPDISVNSFSI